MTIYRKQWWYVIKAKASFDEAVKLDDKAKASFDEAVKQEADAEKKHADAEETRGSGKNGLRPFLKGGYKQQQ